MKGQIIAQEIEIPLEAKSLLEEIVKLKLDMETLDEQTKEKIDAMSGEKLMLELDMGALKESIAESINISETTLWYI